MENFTLYLFDRVIRRGNLRRLWARLRHQSTRLLSLYDAGHHTRCCYGGRKQVPIHQIRGSESRCDDFDINFFPLHDRVAARWQRIADAWLQGVELPPVELIQIGDTYYVRDGHHRISVARALGSKQIEAVITRWE